MGVRGDCRAWPSLIFMAGQNGVSAHAALRHPEPMKMGLVCYTVLQRLSSGLRPLTTWCIFNPRVSMARTVSRTRTCYPDSGNTHGRLFDHVAVFRCPSLSPVPPW